jgi:voltage-gated potassium channel
VKRQWRRVLRAQLRDAHVLFAESQTSLLFFAAVIIGGAVALRLFYACPDTGQHPPFGEALYAALSLVFFNSVFPYPNEWYLQLLFFAIPILGLAAGAETVMSLGSALMNKQGRAQKWQVAMASTYRDHVVVCGLGKVGYQATVELLKSGREVVAVEIDPDGRFVGKALERGIPVIIADARRSEMLIKAGVQRADAIITCTDDELTNLDISLDARELNPGIKVVMRMFDPDLASRVQHGFGIHTAFSSSALAAPIFAVAAMRLDVKHSFYIGDVLLNVSEFTVEPGSQLVGRSIGELEMRLNLSVICCQSGDCHNLRPQPDLALKAGDRLWVLATLDELFRLRELNEQATGQ